LPERAAQFSAFRASAPRSLPKAASSGHIDGYALFPARGALLVESIDDENTPAPQWRGHDITMLENSLDAAGQTILRNQARIDRISLGKQTAVVAKVPHARAMCGPRDADKPDRVRHRIRSNW
jgi:hypothetical protein